ncbi:MAG: nitrate reductase [Alteromonadaceae bacterium]|nr:nitrate reductase [Alteromonadaceae bacterium]
MVQPKAQATTCPYCGVGCGVLARASGSASIEPVSGDPDHPANFGRLCIKGSSLAETLGDQNRLRAPEVDGKRVGWDEALDAITRRLATVRAQHGPEAIAFYLSGQLLTEDYYVANKLAKGFLGTPHVDTNSRLCMSSAVASYKRAFGADVVPGCYEDLELADLLVLVGSNTAWNHPVLYQRIKAAGEGRPNRKIIVIDPRRTATCEIADLHLQLHPGTDAYLFNGLLSWLAATGAVAEGWVQERASGMDAAVAAAKASAPSPREVAEVCDLAEADVEAFYRLFADTQRTVTFYSQGINQSVRGTDQGSAIINCHLATGRVGLPGASPFSITGQPNAMGGREVGGLANQLAAHTDYETPGARDCVQAFWNSPELPEAAGLKAVEMFDAVASGAIQAIWIMATNPVVSMPDAERVKAALANCPLVIVSDCVDHTDTLDLAHIKLPAQGWSEKDGTVTNSERRLSRQRGLLPAVGESRPDWWALAQVGQRLGFKAAFDYPNPAAVFREHAALSAQTVKLGGGFDISALAELGDQAYRDLTPLQWPVTHARPLGTARQFGQGRFRTPDGRARFHPVALPVHVGGLVADAGKNRHEDPLSQSRPNAESTPGSFYFNTGRLRDQWHTMSRTGRSPRLWQHTSESFLAMAPADADRMGVADGQFVRVSGAAGQLVLRLRRDSGQRQGEVFAPIHWNEQWTGAGRVGGVIRPSRDPASGQPAFKHSRVDIEPVQVEFHAVLLSQHAPPGLDALTYWSRTPMANTQAWRVAGQHAPDRDGVARLLGGAPQLEMLDAADGRQRYARVAEGRLQAVLMIEREFHFPALDWLDELFGHEQLDAQDRKALLAASPAGVEDTGPVICSCFQVGEKTILSAIGEGCDSPAALGEKLKCGTNCGSCLPEIKALVERCIASAT